jgi:hypothetical protein
LAASAAESTTRGFLGNRKGYAEEVVAVPTKDGTKSFVYRLVPNHYSDRDPLEDVDGLYKRSCVLAAFSRMVSGKCAGNVIRPVSASAEIST